MAFKVKQYYINANVGKLTEAINTCNDGISTTEGESVYNDAFSLAWTKGQAYAQGCRAAGNISKNSKTLRKSLNSLSHVVKSLEEYQKTYKNYKRKQMQTEMAYKTMKAHENDENKTNYDTARRHWRNLKKEKDQLEKQLIELNQAIEGAIGV